MTIRHLRIFIEVADSGKMSVAASKLFISQPTVSQTIRELEEYYEVLLFERLCKRLHITPEGKKLLSYARKVVKQYDDLEEKMFSISGVNKIYIGATITVGNCLLSNIIQRIKENNPKIEPYAYVNNTSTIEERLLKSELDIALVEGKITNPNLICIPAVDDYLVLVCSKDHIFSKRKEVNLYDLQDMDFVMREKGSGTRQLFEDYLLDNGVTIKTRWETNCPGAMKSAIIEHQCLGVLSVRLVEEEIKNGEMKLISNPEFKWERNFSIVYHKDKIIDKTMEEVIEVIRRYKEIDILEKLY
ncbi:LysR family transcriptional regulator [Tissierella carlieri]|uniref:LysR family transcriptional regulator n=1 Tax=Tissierella carlieri TaxID=689904 RepID=A0ABT1S9V0_9FIRM|nr:LysR family transcriptional regulator [Tissierella carlieri]MBU5314331.1 LysR family transcriptional regulator [Tissierella carlieri]MCQ4923259.1 LysR family transcriptional regulator [Tissierella carlieri]